MEQSKKFSYNKEDLKAIGRGALVAMGGALITYLLEQLPSMDFGQWTPVVVAVAGIILNSARKFIAGK